MLTGLQKFSGKAIRQRASSPKLLVMDTALMTARSRLTFEETRKDGELWGRLVESAAGAHLVNGTIGTSVHLFYWREGTKEVDFIIQKGKSITALEVKSGRRRENLSGIKAFSEAFRPQRTILVGEGGIPLERFFRSPISGWLG